MKKLLFNILVGFIAFVTAVMTLWFIRQVALRFGWVHRPTPDKWQSKANPHLRPIAMGGGLGIYLGIALALYSPISQFPSFPIFYLFVPLALLLGILDDIKDYSPRLKLLFQTLLGFATVLWFGYVKGLPLWLALPITVFGIVGMMNSVNMMDNMDGTASGLVALAMVGYALLGLMSQNAAIIPLSLAIAGACMGFWLFNKPPATIFMGDAGSLMLGYLFAIVGTFATQGDYPHLFGQLFAPALLAGLFITDTTFVVLWRKAHGRPVMKGDRNHLSHRLAFLFHHSEWKANSVLYTIQALLVLAAVMTAHASLPLAILCFLAAVAGLVGLGVRLWQVEEPGGRFS